MQNAPTIEIGADEARELYQDYAEQIKERGDKAEKYLKELKQTYYHLSQGRKVIDIFEVFKNSGLRENGDPFLGLARADWNKVVFHKLPMGAAAFTKSEKNALDWQGNSQVPAGSVELPSTTFPTWKAREVPENSGEWEKSHPGLDRSKLQSKVPIIPAHILPNGSLENYYILFEVLEGQWAELPVPPVAADPYLLKRINANAFVVLAEWDITPIEQAIMRA
jgi:hypothetical protein